MNCVSEGATAALWPSCAYEMLGGVQRSGETSTRRRRMHAPHGWSGGNSGHPHAPVIEVGFVDVESAFLAPFEQTSSTPALQRCDTLQEISSRGGGACHFNHESRNRECIIEVLSIALHPCRMGFCEGVEVFVNMMAEYPRVVGLVTRVNS